MVYLEVILTGPTFTTLILHWNGKAWKQVPSPNPVTISSSKLTWNILQSVAATSAGNTWAVGYSEEAFKGSKTMILRWNGKAWKQVPSPNPFCATCDSLYGVTATSARSAWAVGTVNVGGEVVILRWNGTTWKNFQSASVLRDPSPEDAHRPRRPAAVSATPRGSQPIAVSSFRAPRLRMPRPVARVVANKLSACSPVLCRSACLTDQRAIIGACRSFVARFVHVISATTCRM